jgi:hypothetical protein
MSDSNLRYWDVLGRTDPSHTKPFDRPGGFKGTAIKPIWTEKRLTETFGPCGIGWGCEEPQFSTMPAPNDEILVYCTLRCWYKDGDKVGVLYGVGGDKVVGKNKYGLYTDDEAFKKAFTDALGNAFKHLGASADIHMGMFEDSKYVAETRREFSESHNGGGLDDGYVKTLSTVQRQTLIAKVKEAGLPEDRFLEWRRVDSFASIPAKDYQSILTALDKRIAGQVAAQ